jgi:hypothetical protein
VVDWFCFDERVWAECVHNGVAVWSECCTVHGAMVYESGCEWTG